MDAVRRRTRPERPQRPRRPRHSPRLVRPGTVLPTIALAAASVIVAIHTAAPATTTPSAAPAPKASPVSFKNRAPITSLSSITQTPGGVRATGWAFDPDSQRKALRVYSTVDGKGTNIITASASRKAVAKAYPQAGKAHGFSLRVPVREGRHTICLVATNVGRGKNHRIGCRTMTLDYGPIGRLDSVGTVPGSLRIRGWAIDSDKVSAPVNIVVRIDKTNHTVTANRSRPDVAHVRSGAGRYHGYDATIRVSEGKHTVCVTGVSIGYGSNNSLGCRTLTLNDKPIVRIDSAGQSAGKLRVRGWTFDNDKATTSLPISIQVDSTLHAVTANTSRPDVAKAYTKAGKYHGFDQSFSLPEGTHRVCVTATNIGYGSNTAMPCTSITLNFTPSASLAALTATSTGISMTGWASDPDTSSAIPVALTFDGKALKTVTANAKGATHSGHNFTASLVTTSGPHTVCATGRNVLYGHADSAQACRTITLALKPVGTFDSLKRSGSSTNITLTGWAFDPDTTAAVSVTMTLDGAAAGTVRATGSRPDVAGVYPSAGTSRGFSATLTATDGEHKVCLVATNVGGGSDASLGCRIINAVHPVAPKAPGNVRAVGGYAAATVTWTAPTSDGGAPWTKYVVTASPGGATVNVGPTALSTVVPGLKAKTTYSFTVRAVNVVGTSAAGTSAKVTTQAGPAPQTTPAPISTSRYIRNIRGSSAAEQTTLRNEGAADARANPTGHRYLVLLDIGGQSSGGVVLSATTRFVTYAALVADVKAYIDGYHSQQHATAPATIAIGTNNDMDVSVTTGKAWATAVVNPLVAYARKYTGIAVAGANDIEPGFSASYTATHNWLTGYLAATSAGFVFNGSADGCAYTVTNRNCNNGWTMSALYMLAAGAAPTRVTNLPQIYNNTMADQWKFISLTGVGQGHPRINFGGPLTEYTACAQAGSCGSLGGKSAWQRLWNNLQSNSALKVSSLPYSTDLRIDR